MAEQYYCLALDDYSLPGFCSGGKAFYGTLEQISVLLQSLDDRFQDSKEALKAFIAGKTGATHTVGYNKIQLMYPVEEVMSETLEFGEHHWEHYNVWDCIYRMKAEAIKVEQILLQVGNEYIRAIRPLFTELRFDEDGPNEILKFWGFPNMLVRMGNQIQCSLFIEIASYDSFEGALADMGKLEHIDFKEVMDEVFGDG